MFMAKLKTSPTILQALERSNQVHRHGDRDGTLAPRESR